MNIYTYRNYDKNSIDYAKICLKHYLGKSANISYYGTGKPYVVGEDVYISVSHTGSDLVVAVSDSEVGVDIEYKRSRHFDSIARHMLGDKEIKSLDEFYLEWTKYESKFKHGGEDGVYRTFDIFADTVLTVYSRDEEYIFIPMEQIIVK